MVTAAENLTLWPEEDPVGEAINNSPAHQPSRPVLRLFREGIPSDLDPTGTLLRRVLSARDLIAETERRQNGEADALPTALPALDQLLAGGLDRGRLVELVGRRSSGRLSAVLAVLAAATACGEAAALVDLGDGLDPRLAEAVGIDLERLLWVRPRRLKEALRAAELLLAAGFPLVVVEMGPPPVAGGRGSESFWLRLARAARERQSALLISAPYRVSGTAAAAVLHARRLRPRWVGGGAAPTLLVSAEGHLELEKHRHQRPGTTATLPLISPESTLAGTPKGPDSEGRQPHTRGASPVPGAAPKADGRDSDVAAVAAERKNRTSKPADGSTSKRPDSEGRRRGPATRTRANSQGSAVGPQPRPEADGRDGALAAIAARREQRTSNPTNVSTPKGPDSEGRGGGPTARTQAKTDPEERRRGPAARIRRVRRQARATG